MKRSEMVCATCIKQEGGFCHLNPVPLILTPDLRLHWCAQGEWTCWSEKYQEMEPFCWGEWEDIP